MKEEIEQELRRRPHLEAKRLFVWLQQQYPSRLSDGQLRTLQRRVKGWRLRQASLVAEEIGSIFGKENGGSNYL